MFKNVLVSVSDKTGLVEFIKPIFEKGARILSTGGTAQFLESHGIKVTDVSQQTGFPEVMGGRVKTLHPNVHMSLLARMDKSEDLEVLKSYKLELFDLVVVNLYPFEDALKSGAQYLQLIEKIDVGGPTMLRAAAKNHASIAVVCDPSDYDWIQNKGYQLDLEDRQNLALKVFARTGAYDQLISQNLLSSASGQFRSSKSRTSISTANSSVNSTTEEQASSAVFGASLVQSLRYGENPHQQASWYGWSHVENGLQSAKILQGKELSYNNILDIDAAVNLLQHLDGAGCVAVKHNNPCGASVDRDLLSAVDKCLKADPVSVFGGIVAMNRTVDGPVAKILSEIFLECLVAPKFEVEALTYFEKKKSLRLLEWPGILTAQKKLEIKSVFGGYVQQDCDSFESSEKWNYMGEKPDPSILNDCIFGEKVCAALKSNSIAIVKNGVTLGLGMGQVNRVDSVELALKRYHQFHPKVQDPILISDAFFPFPDSIELAARSGIRWIVQPGGSVRDQEVFAVAEKLGVNIIVTGYRHFRH